MPLAVTVMIEHGLLRHQDRMRVTGTLAETASNDAGKGFDYLDHIFIRHYKDIFRANLDTLPTTIAQRRRDSGEPGDLLAGDSLPGAIILRLHVLPLGALLIITLIFSAQNTFIFFTGRFGNEIMLADLFEETFFRLR